MIAKMEFGISHFALQFQKAVKMLHGSLRSPTKKLSDVCVTDVWLDVFNMVLVLFDEMKRSHFRGQTKRTLMSIIFIYLHDR